MAGSMSDAGSGLSATQEEVADLLCQSSDCVSEAVDLLREAAQTAATATPATQRIGSILGAASSMPDLPLGISVRWSAPPVQRFGGDRNQLVSGSDCGCDSSVAGTSAPRRDPFGFHPADIVVSLRQVLARSPSQTLTMPTTSIHGISADNNDVTLVLCLDGWRHLIVVDMRVLVEGVICSEPVLPPRVRPMAPADQPPARAPPADGRGTVGHNVPATPGPAGPRRDSRSRSARPARFQPIPPVFSYSGGGRAGKASGRSSSRRSPSPQL